MKDIDTTFDEPRDIDYHKFKELLKIFKIELLEIIDDCASDWSYIERAYYQRFNKFEKEVLE
jgi:hypothetical protein